MFILAVLVCMASVGAHTQSNYSMAIHINNPFAISVDVTVKCDWDPTIKAFKFKKDFPLLSKKMTTIVLPESYHDCQIWPHNFRFFGN